MSLLNAPDVLRNAETVLAPGSNRLVGIDPVIKLVLPMANPNTVNINDYWQNAGSPASRQIYTCPTGYSFYCYFLCFTSPNASSNSVSPRDGTADGATKKILFQAAASASSVFFSCPDPIIFDNGVRVDAGDLSANLWCGVTMVGHLVKK